MTADPIISALQLFGMDADTSASVVEKTEHYVVFEKPGVTPKNYQPEFSLIHIPLAACDDMEGAIVDPAPEGGMLIGIIDLPAEPEKFDTAFRRVMRKDVDILIIGILNRNTNIAAIQNQIFTAAETGRAVYLIHEPECELRMTYDEWRASLRLR